MVKTMVSSFLQRFSKENQSNELFDDWQVFFEKNGAISG